MVVAESPDDRRRPPLARSALFMYGTQVAVALLSLLNVLIVARTLGPSGRGEVAFLIAVAYLVSQFALLGVHQANANIGAGSPRVRPALATNSLLFAVLTGAAGIGVVAALMAAFPSVGGGLDPWLRWLALAAVPMLILQNHLLLLVQASYGFAVANTAWLLGPVTNAAVNGTLAAVGELTVGAALATWIAGQGLGVLLLSVYLTRSSGFSRPDGTLARRTLAFGLKAHPGRVMLLGNYRLDQWLLGAISGPRELGLYSVAVAWAETLFYLPTVLTQVQRPDLVRGADREAVRLATTAVRAAFLATVPLVVVLLAAAPFLCGDVFGEKFEDAAGELRILTIGGFGIILLKLLGAALTAQRRPLRESAAVGLAFVCTVVLDVVLIPPYAGTGAAVASTLAYTAGGIGVVVLFVRTLPASVVDLVPRVGDVPWLLRKLTGGLRPPPPADADARRAPVGLP